MDLDYINLVACVVLALVDKQQMDHQNILVDKHNLEYDLKHRKLLVFHKYSYMDQRICCLDRLSLGYIPCSLYILVDNQYMDLQSNL